jgi:hypothetical protein
VDLGKGEATKNSPVDDRGKRVVREAVEMHGCAAAP